MSGSSGRFSDAWDNLVARSGSVTQLMIWACVIVFFVQLFCHLFKFDQFNLIFGLSGADVRRGFVWQFFTYMFLHDIPDLFHIIINMMLLWFFGKEVESFIGPKSFLRLYVLAGLLGGGFWLLANFNERYVLMGASAAVLGCVIAFATLFPDRRITLFLFFVVPVSLKARTLAIVAILLDVIPIISRSGGDVAHLAHLGGAAFGYVYIKHLGYGHPPRWIDWIQSRTARLKPRRPQTRARPRPASRPGTPTGISAEAYIREQVDPILEKISRQGMQSLTPEERRILESAQDLLRKR